MFDIFKDLSSNKLREGKAIIGEKILLKNNGTFTLSIDYDFERHSNYYDFDYFFMFWDREKKEWVNEGAVIIDVGINVIGERNGLRKMKCLM